MAAVYVFGYVVGSLLVERVDEEFGLAWSVIRTVAGLLLTTAGFLLSLEVAGDRSFRCRTSAVDSSRTASLPPSWP